jgi:hypothetical protein
MFRLILWSMSVAQIEDKATFYVPGATDLRRHMAHTTPIDRDCKGRISNSSYKPQRYSIQTPTSDVSPTAAESVQRLNVSYIFSTVIEFNGSNDASVVD